MRKKLWVCVILICSLFLNSCNSILTKEEEITTIKIGVLVYRGEDTFVASIYDELEAAVEAKEEETGKSIILNMEDAKSSQLSQNNQIDEYINKEYDVLCVNLVDRTVAALVINKAQEAGIPIVFFNREPVSEDLEIWEEHTYYVGSNSVQAGELAGKIVAQAYFEDPLDVDKNNDGKLQYVMIEGEESHQDAMIRTEYSVKSILNAGINVDKLASGSASWMRSPAYELMLNWISEYGRDIEVVISNNDEMAIGALEAIGEYTMSDPLVIGTDGTVAGLKMVEEGLMYGTVYNDAKLQADYILDIAVADVLGEEVEERIVKVDHTIITYKDFE